MQLSKATVDSGNCYCINLVTELFISLDHFAKGVKETWDYHSAQLSSVHGQPQVPVLSAFCVDSGCAIPSHCRGQPLDDPYLLIKADILAWPWKQVSVPNRVFRIWVNSQEPCPGFNFLSMIRLGSIRACSKSHLVLEPSEMLAPKIESEQTDWKGGQLVRSS